MKRVVFLAFAILLSVPSFAQSNNQEWEGKIRRHKRAGADHEGSSP